MTRLVHSRAEFFAARAELGDEVSLVTTMGALHAGHAALLQVGRNAAPAFVATIFVNPMQFGPTEDLAKYPRTLEADLAICEQAGVDVVWAPAVEDVYADGAAQVTVQPGPLGSELEGASRPGHFAGVLTVVAKLFNLTRPSIAFFGEKDYQQFTLIERMALDLDLGVHVAAVPTVREPDGLALSSRNAYLSPVERQQAVALSRALFAGQAAAAEGAQAVLAAAHAVLAGADGVELDYLELRGADLREVRGPGEARLLIAARVGTTRLIDNVEVIL